MWQNMIRETSRSKEMKFLNKIFGCGDKVNTKSSQFLLPKVFSSFLYADPLKCGPVDGTTYIEQSQTNHTTYLTFPFSLSIRRKDGAFEKFSDSLLTSCSDNGWP